MNRRVSIPVKAGGPGWATGMAGTATVDAGALERDLADAVEGEVRFDAGSRALYATDASNFRQPPIGVVIPRSIDDIVATHAVCHDHRAPILARGCGTSLSGETVNHAVVIDCSKYLHRVLRIDEGRQRVTVQPGAINEQVNVATGPHGLLFGPDPSTHKYCTIGGNIGNNSCGIHSLQARFQGDGSRTSDNVAEMEVLTYDGVRLRVGPTPDDEIERVLRAGGRPAEIFRSLLELRDRYAPLIRERFPRIPRRVSGYNLDELLPERGFNLAAALVGTEGTCVTVLEATLKLIPRPAARSLLVIGYDDIFAVADHLGTILDHRPIGCEAIDHTLFRDEQQLGIHPESLHLLPDGSAWVLVEFGGETKDESDDRARRLQRDLGKDPTPPRGTSLFDDPAQESRLWLAREAGLGATAFGVDGRDHWPGWEDSAVAPEHVGAYLHDLRALYGKYGLDGAFYGHLGDGCIHSRISFDLRTPRGVRDYRAFLEEAADLVVSYGGSLSGEHGDGQQRAELLPKMYGEELVEAFRAFKRAWDPDWKMNPGKVVDPYRLDENLKLGTDYEPWRPRVRFSYRDDGGDFAHAALRCVGVGKCRTPDTDDVMCPSFQVLREERHSTRGRARLLFEMLEGEIVTDGWRSHEVKEALDLCLACKGCTNDCPVNVDIPTYKAEFLHHYWKGARRPRHAYAFGLIDQIARVAAHAPRAANALASTTPLSSLMKRAAGMAPERAIPRFAPVTLQQWFARRGAHHTGGEKVLLWPDTFSNHFHTEIGIAAVESLESAGFQVVMPAGHVCCGRPLYDYGFLGLAERYLRTVLDRIRSDVRDGVPVVGIEPSCVAVFKDELVKLLPHDDDAKRLRTQTFHYAEFLRDRDVSLPRLEGRALVWGHCHHKATGGIDSEVELLHALGLETEVATGGCCGLAGSWGFEAGHYELSLRCGEEGILPAVRTADPSTLVVADGFSCRTQIAQATGRDAVHVAQVLHRAQV
ncbi:MAG TPA: FAD-binding and (Fe-S)-binding domain-containing protein [Acidimicrobiia bacterium]